MGKPGFFAVEIENQIIGEIKVAQRPFSHLCDQCILISADAVNRCAVSGHPEYLPEDFEMLGRKCGLSPRASLQELAIED